MNVTEFTFRLIFLFLPGLITFLVVDVLTTHRPIPTVRTFLYSLVLGFLCYFAYYPLTLIPSLDLPFSFVESLTNNEKHLNVIEILWVSILSVPLGLLISKGINGYWLHWVAYKFNVTKRFPDADVWSYVMNQGGVGSEWVVIRDLEHDLVYEGWVAAFADSTDDFDEVLLTDAHVYRNTTGEKLYELPGVYISTKHGSKIVEFPSLDI